jgi:enoyl-CoA hydratase/carnithine racemase
LLKDTHNGRILQLTLARPDKRNALNAALLRNLLDAIRSANAERSIGVILLDAEGPSFSAGMDLDEAPGADAAALGALHTDVFAIREELTKPLVVAVSGSAFGGALGLIANAHIAIASSEAHFGLTELRVGMWPFMVWRSVSAAIGERRAAELALTSRVFGAVEAQAIGLVHSVAPPDEVAPRARELAQLLAASSAETIARGLRAARNPELTPVLRAEQFASADFKEGVAAFREKRPPRWPSLGGGR